MPRLKDLALIYNYNRGNFLIMGVLTHSFIFIINYYFTLNCSRFDRIIQVLSGKNEKKIAHSILLSFFCKVFITERPLK